MVAAHLTELEDDAWRGFLLTHDRVWREVEAGLSALNVSMAEYSVLALLGGAGRDGMRMTDLARRRVMSTGGFTRLADRLERRGLITRRPAPDDGRGLVAVLTADGRSLLRKAWEVQHADLRRLFFDRLDEQDLKDLSRIWARLRPDPSSHGPDDGPTRRQPGPRP
ncbi:MarR family transcriptional regulator [Microbacterium soli]|uniref:MarR family transcriptional regulator n=1 Tax=Microbacterium soli TaxID=446075 RepID=A0ABP7MXE7_9MICO